MIHCRDCGAPFLDGFDHRACRIFHTRDSSPEWDGTWEAKAACGCDVTWRAKRGGTFGTATVNEPDPCPTHDPTPEEAA